MKTKTKVGVGLAAATLALSVHLKQKYGFDKGDSTLEIFKTWISWIFPDRNSDGIFKKKIKILGNVAGFNPNTLELNINDESRITLIDHPMIYFYFLAIKNTLTTPQDSLKHDEITNLLKNNNDLMFHVRFLATTKLQEIHCLLFKSFTFYNLDENSFFDSRVLKVQQFYNGQTIDNKLSSVLLSMITKPIVRIVLFPVFKNYCTSFFNVQESFLYPFREFYDCNNILNTFTHLQEYIQITPGDHKPFYDKLLTLKNFQQFQREYYTETETIQAVVIPDRFVINIYKKDVDILLSNNNVDKDIRLSLPTIFYLRWLTVTKKSLVIKNKVITNDTLFHLVNAYQNCIRAPFFFQHEFYFYFSEQDMKTLLNFNGIISDNLFKLIYTDMSKYWKSEQEINLLDKTIFLKNIKELQMEGECELWGMNNIDTTKDNYSIFLQVLDTHKSVCGDISNRAKDLVCKNVFY